MLAAAFSFKPVLVSGIGSATFPRVREDENAAYATAVLERLHADGRLGAYWWCWRDDAASVGVPHEPLAGIIRADGTEKPVAMALAAFARESRKRIAPADMPMISSTYYYRTLPVSMQTLYDAYLAFVAERRAAE
jgi:endo-1,4-beta-mannosidase